MVKQLSILLLSLSGCVAVVEQQSVMSRADMLAAMDKLMLNYLELMRKTRINLESDPTYKTGQMIEVSASLYELHTAGKFIQVSWDMLKADKIEVLRCQKSDLTKELPEHEGKCADVHKLDFAELSKPEKANECGFIACQMVTSNLINGNKINDIQAKTEATYFYYVRGCYDNYLHTTGSATASTTASGEAVQCGADKISASAAQTTGNTTELIQKYCNSTAAVICSDASISNLIALREGITALPLDLFEKRQKIIKELEEISQRIVENARAAVRAFHGKDIDNEMDADLALAEAQTVHMEQLVKHKADTANKKEEMKKEINWWAIIASAPGALVPSVPDCGDAIENGKQYYIINSVKQGVPEEAISQEAAENAGDYAYFNCVTGHIEDIAGYIGAEDLSAFDVNTLINLGIAMIPMPNSELNQRSMEETLFVSFETLSTSEEEFVERGTMDVCKECQTFAISLRHDRDQLKQKKIELKIVNAKIAAKLTPKGVTDPYAKQDSN